MTDKPRLNENYTTKWIDVSMPLYNGMLTWPGDPPFQNLRIMDIESGDDYTLSELHLSTHTGTHIDAPLHYCKRGSSADAVSLDALNGKARVISINKEMIYRDDISVEKIHSGQRILFQTRNSYLLKNRENFSNNFVSLTKDAARYLASCHIRMIGIDYLSIAGLNDTFGEIHKILLESGIYIIEGLDLSSVTPGNYELHCLPLKIINGDGAPARAVLRRS